MSFNDDIFSKDLFEKWKLIFINIISLNITFDLPILIKFISIDPVDFLVPTINLKLYYFTLFEN